MDIINQSFYTEGASLCINIIYVPSKWANPEDDPHTAEEFKNYPWDQTVTPLTIIEATDVTIDGWSGFYFEDLDENMSFYSSGYYFYNEEGDRVTFSQIKRNGTYLPLENIVIE